MCVKVTCAPSGLAQKLLSHVCILLFGAILRALSLSWPTGTETNTVVGSHVSKMVEPLSASVTD